MALRQSSSSRRQARLGLDRIAWTLIVAAGAFYAGILVGMHSNNRHPHPRHVELTLQKRVQQKVQEIISKRRDICKEKESSHANYVDYSNSNSQQQLRFGEATSHFALGVVRVGKDDFLETFQDGFPEDYGNLDPAAQEVLIFYNQRSALPDISTEETMRMGDSSSGGGLPPPKLTAMDATLNCHVLHVVSTKSALPQCVALVPQHESFHIQRWMRIANNVDDDDHYYGKGISRDLPLAPVGRGQLKNGKNEFETPSKQAAELNFRQLQTYVEGLSSNLDQLRPLLERVAVDNTVIVMVCNKGHADLLTNFACSNATRGFTLQGILVFCTDQETCDIATGLGMASFYAKKNFQTISSLESKEYGDKTFQELMYAKVVAVQLVNWLGYDVLFQDVDVVWLRNPLDKLLKLHPSFDLLFQDDGARSLRYAPYFANSGFYLIRFNENTRHFLVRMLYAGDTITTSASHQQALNSLLSEHASLYGLRSKTLNMDDFPGGFHFHHNPEFMRNMMMTMTADRKKGAPCIFHMSWTNGKLHKIKFLQQMGLWFVSEDGRCLAEPIVSCHYRDKPSIRPCRHSPALDKNGKSFWV